MLEQLSAMIGVDLGCGSTEMTRRSSKLVTMMAYEAGIIGITEGSVNLIGGIVSGQLEVDIGVGTTVAYRSSVWVTRGGTKKKHEGAKLCSKPYPLTVANGEMGCFVFLVAKVC